MELIKLGHKVPQLDLRPDLPQHVEIVAQAYRDLVFEGHVPFREFAAWGEHYLYSQDQFDYVWDVLCEALSVVNEWKAKSSSKNSVKTTGSSPIPKVTSQVPSKSMY